MDNLEQFIKNNRKDLDFYSPSPAIWRRIRRNMWKRSLWGNNWIRIAAMFLIIIGTAAILFNITNRRSAGNSDISGSQSALKETEIYYNNLVNSLYREAKPLLTGQPEVASELQSGLVRLDSICGDIRKDLKDNIANREVIEALIQNYRFKLMLLEDMLAVLKQNENKPEKKESHEL